MHDAPHKTNSRRLLLPLRFVTLRAIAKRVVSDARAYQRLAGSRQRRRDRSLLLTILTSPGLWILESHRLKNHLRRHPRPRALSWHLTRILQHVVEFLTAVCTKSEVLEDCEIGSGVYLSNKGYIICGAHRVGSGSMIHDHCTLGGSVADDSARPTIGHNVWIGRNCIIAGELTIGDGATILPGTFLTFSISSGAVVKGNPAQVIARGFDNSAIRSSIELINQVDAHAAQGTSSAP